MKRVIGLGGVFIKCTDKPKLLEWYKTHLGIPAEDWGAVFRLDQTLADAPAATNVWSLFASDSKYFEPSEKPFMINFMVADLHALLAALREEGVTVLGNQDDATFGKFGWILDPEGNKVELWEPPATHPQL